MRVKTAVVALAVAAGTLAAAPVARAQCGKPDLVDMVPPDGATDVPRDATLGAHYAASAEYLGEEVVLVHPDGSEQLLDATWEPTEQLLSAMPTAAMTANSSYEIRWPVLRGLNAAAPGLGGSARFTTGAALDTAPPVFAGVAGLSWDLERKTDDCADDDLVERFLFDVDLGAASDDGGTSGLTLMLFQTRGPQVFGMPVPIPARAWPQQGMRAQVKLAADDAVGEICFAGLVRDTVGQISGGGDVQACVHTTDPPFFNGCSVSGGSGARGSALASLLPLAALLLRRRARART
jgi:hypothetical protein